MINDSIYCNTSEKIPLFFDWLGVTISMLDSPPASFCGLSLVMQTPTNVWNKRGIYVNEVGDKVISLLWEPRSSIIGNKYALFELANEWLYHGAGAKFWLSSFCSAVKADVIGISRVDLAIDFEVNEFRYNIIEGLAKGIYYVGGKRHGSLFWSTSSDNRLYKNWRGIRIPHCISWGHKTSSLKWKLYYKWKELCESAGKIGYSKPYIVTEWENLGFTVSKVWRLELSIKHAASLTYNGNPITLPLLFNAPIDIFRSLYCLRFQVKKDEGHIDKSNDENIEFLPIASFYNRVSSRVYASDSIRSSPASLLRKLILSLKDEGLLYNENLRESTLSFIEYLCESEHLVSYASSVLNSDVWEWIEKARLIGAEKGSIENLFEKI